MEANDPGDRSAAAEVGAAHMGDFHARLAKKGWTQKSHKWVTAWQIGGERKGEKDDDDTRSEDRTPVPSGGSSKRRWF